MDHLNSLLTRAAQMSVGQCVLRWCDKALYVVEKTAQWSLPTSQTGMIF